MTVEFHGSDDSGLDSRGQFADQVSLEATLYPPNSRYHGLRASKYRASADRTIPYLERRFLAQPSNFEELRQHTVSQGDRIDNLAYRYLGDSDQFWRICDANVAMDPADLTAEPGRRLRITLPQGIPGAPHA